MGAGGGDGDLLAQHDPHGQLRLVDGARDALARGLGHQGAEVGVGAERVDHGLRVGVEVEQPAAAGDRRGQVAEVVEHELAAHMVGRGVEADDAVAVGRRRVRR